MKLKKESVIFEAEQQKQTKDSAEDTTITVNGKVVQDKDGNDITASIQSGSVIINLDNENDWKYNDDGYYYYKYLLRYFRYFL